eukprot:Unigene16884_Nuclearia_a/m.49751 Unigene16884_Nuclearia_a/g.49751  ORF Unigene16884_Nuclearia_a/g.49751 Unigene16884_Nuclearia_a/m.49751 type:complete len:361 (-) Unigene16884_Nuclearia_a:156-1238(-)
MMRTRRRDARRTPPENAASEILLVPDVGHGALVRILVGEREGILAAGDDVFRAHGELAAPRRAPGHAETQAFPLAGLARDVDDAADDVGAEGTVAATDRQAARIPPVGEGRHIRHRHQGGLGHGAADRHETFATDVLLPEYGQVVLFDAACSTAGGQPGRQRVATGARRQAQLAAGTAQDRRRADTLAVGVVIVVAERGEHAMAGEVADIAHHAGLAVADQAQGIAAVQAEGGGQCVAAQAPAGAGLGLAGGLKQQDRLDLAVVVPDGEGRGLGIGGLACRRLLRIRIHRHAGGEQQGKRQCQATQVHGSLQTPRTTWSSPPEGELMLCRLCFFNKSPGRWPDGRLTATGRALPHRPAAG